MKKPPARTLGRKGHERAGRGVRATYTLELAARLTGAEPELIRYYHVRGILHARSAQAAEPVFDDDTIYELRRLEHYRRHLGANREALVLIGGLLREVARLEVELRHAGRA
ncbi:MAG TPA: hypothetical protein VIJ19_10675 [Opitutaceae bacterium]